MQLDEKGVGFEEVSPLGRGELVVSVPGTTFKMPYSDGKTFVDITEGMGYAALSIEDLVVEKTHNPLEAYTQGVNAARIRKDYYPWLDMAESAEEVGAKLDDPSVREETLRRLRSGSLYLAYSRSGLNDHEALTMPGTSVGAMNAALTGQIDANIDNVSGNHNLGLYDMFLIIGWGEEQRLKSILDLHKNVVFGLESIFPADRKTLEYEVSNLVSKANSIYNHFSTRT